MQTRGSHFYLAQSYDILLFLGSVQQTINHGNCFGFLTQIKKYKTNLLFSPIVVTVAALARNQEAMVRLHHR